MSFLQLVSAIFIAHFQISYAAVNGKGLKPPLGFRTWNLFGRNITQDLLEQLMTQMVNRSRLVNGVPTSLYDLGYTDVGIDDNGMSFCNTFI